MLTIKGPFSMRRTWYQSANGTGFFTWFRNQTWDTVCLPLDQLSPTPPSQDLLTLTC